MVGVAVKHPIGAIAGATFEIVPAIQKKKRPWSVGATARGGNMGLARGLLRLVSMPLLANLTSWLRPQPENGIPCGTILKQSKMHVQH